MITGQRVLITGANSGIGLSICETFLQNNANLVLFYHEKRNGIDKLLEKYDNLRDRIEIKQVDLLNDKDLEHAMNSVLESKSIDIFIHSITLPIENKSIVDTTWQDYQSHIEIQTKSFIRIAQSLIPSMKTKRRGKILSILTSYTIGKPPSGISSYIVGKYSLLGLSKSMAVELGQYGITVNCISPSMTETPLIEKLPSKLKEITAQQSPLGRLAQPTDIASVVLFLSSKHSDYITGENLIVAGGQTMH